MTTSTRNAATTRRLNADTQRRLARVSQQLDQMEEASDPNTQRRRALELATARGYWSVCPPGRSLDMQLDQRGQLVSFRLAIPSASQCGVWHVVEYRVALDDAVCDCPAAQHGQPCWHRGATVRAGRYQARRAARGWPED